MTPGALKLALLHRRLLRRSTLDRMKADGLALGNYSVERWNMPRDGLRKSLAAGGHYVGGDDSGQLRQLYTAMRTIGLVIRQTSKRIDGKPVKVWLAEGICYPATDIFHWEGRLSVRPVNTAWLDWILAHQARYDFSDTGEGIADQLFDGWRDFDWRGWQARCDAIIGADEGETIERTRKRRQRKEQAARPVADDRPAWVKVAEAEDLHRDAVTEQLNAAGRRVIDERTERRRLPNGTERTVTIAPGHWRNPALVLAYGKREREAGKCDAIIDDWYSVGGGTGRLRNDIAWLRQGLQFAGCSVAWERVKDDAGLWTKRLMVRGLRKRRGRKTPIPK